MLSLDEQTFLAVCLKHLPDATGSPLIYLVLSPPFRDSNLQAVSARRRVSTSHDPSRAVKAQQSSPADGPASQGVSCIIIHLPTQSSSPRTQRLKFSNLCEHLLPSFRSYFYIHNRYTVDRLRSLHLRSRCLFVCLQDSPPDASVNVSFNVPAVPCKQEKLSAECSCALGRLNISAEGLGRVAFNGTAGSRQINLGWENPG